MKAMSYAFGFFLILASSALAHETVGGMSGGGGGTIPAEPADQRWIEDTIKNSRVVLTAFLNNEAYLTGPTSVPFGKLFPAQGPNVFEVMRTLRIEIQRTRPCLDFDGRPVDGSVNTGHANTICISSYTLAQKLNQAAVATEIPALVLHEISHLLGTNEPEAVAIQKFVFVHISDVAEADPDDWFLSMNYLADQGAKAANALAAKLNAGQDAPCSDLESLTTKVTPVRSISVVSDIYAFHYATGLYGVLPLVQGWISEQKMLRLGAVRDFLCGLNADQPNKRILFNAKYQVGTGGKSSVSVAEYVKNLTGAELYFGAAPAVKIELWHSPRDAASALSEAGVALEELRDATTEEFRNFPLDISN